MIDIRSQAYAVSFARRHGLLPRNAAPGRHNEELPRLTGVVIPNSGHSLMEEQPAATIAAVSAFLNQKN